MKRPSGGRLCVGLIAAGVGVCLSLSGWGCATNTGGSSTWVSAPAKDFHERTGDVQTGMTGHEVEWLLGKPRATRRESFNDPSSGKSWTGVVWTYHYVDVVFQIDDETGLWVNNVNRR